MIICNDYDEAKLFAVSLISDLKKKKKELTITYNKENKNFTIDYEEFSDNECNEIFGEIEDEEED